MTARDRPLCSCKRKNFYRRYLKKLFVVNFRYETIFRNNKDFLSISSERKSDNKEIGLEANESKQIKLQMLINEFREFYLPQKLADTKIKTKSDLKT